MNSPVKISSFVYALRSAAAQDADDGHMTNSSLLYRAAMLLEGVHRDLSWCAAGPWHCAPERPTEEGMYNIAAWDPDEDPDCLGLLYWQGTRWGFSKDDPEERDAPYAWAGPIRLPEKKL